METVRITKRLWHFSIVCPSYLYIQRLMLAILVVVTGLVSRLWFHWNWSRQETNDDVYRIECVWINVTLSVLYTSLISSTRANLPAPPVVVVVVVGGIDEIIKWRRRFWLNHFPIYILHYSRWSFTNCIHSRKVFLFLLLRTSQGGHGDFISRYFSIASMDVTMATATWSIHLFSLSRQRYYIELYQWPSNKT